MWLLDPTAKTPLFMQIYQQLKKEITDGTLKPSDKLMGSRSLAKLLHVSRNTVEKAYLQLTVEGYISITQGSAPIVSALPVTFEKKRDSQPINVIYKKTGPSPKVIYDLTNSSHTSNLFPKKLWKKHMLEALDFLDVEERLSSLQRTKGELELRKNLLNYLKKIRGVDCTINQLIITSGLQQSLHYLCWLLENNDRRVLMEVPTYPKAKTVFEANQYKIDYSPIDAHGMVIPDSAKQPHPSLIYTTPSHQFPSGTTMSITRRKALLRFAETSGAYIIEDDYDSELRYYEQPIPSLQSIDHTDKVVYLGTFSKILSPSLRMSYMILPKSLVPLFNQKFSSFNSTVTLLNQFTVSRIIESGDYERLVRRRNSTFKKRFEAFSEELKIFEKNAVISENVSGQYFLLNFSKPIDQQLLIKEALKQQVQVYSTMEFWQEQFECPNNSLFLGFSKIKTTEIKDCVARLFRAWEKYFEE